MNYLRLVHIICILVVVSTKAYGQVTYEGCQDFRGQPVASVLDYSINDVAIARIEGGQAVIRYNPNVLAQMTDPTKRFFYVHECAHHALQHTIQAPSLQNERAADCWAIQTMRNQIGLSVNSLRAIQTDISRLGRGDWTHLPGPYRAIDFEACLNGGDRPRERVPCAHRIPCQHRIQCTHTAHPFDTQHPFDQDYYGNRFPCMHRMPCGHTAHQFDTLHPYDTEHEFDYR